jgi:hypothetical protein
MTQQTVRQIQRKTQQRSGMQQQSRCSRSKCSKRHEQAHSAESNAIVAAAADATTADAAENKCTAAAAADATTKADAASPQQTTRVQKQMQLNQMQ